MPIITQSLGHKSSVHCSHEQTWQVLVQATAGGTQPASISTCTRVLGYKMCGTANYSHYSTVVRRYLQLVVADVRLEAEIEHCLGNEQKTQNLLADEA